MRGRPGEHLAKQRLVVEISDDLYQAARAKAAARREPLAAVLRGAIERYVSEDAMPD
jgi:hypothetical protein